MIVTQIGRLQWYVTSESRIMQMTPEGPKFPMVHLVDFEPTEYTKFTPLEGHTTESPKLAAHTVVEPTFCSCEAFNMLHHRPCKHQREVIIELVNSIPLTGEQRERMTYRLEELCRQSPHWVDQTAPDERPASIETKSARTYHLDNQPRHYQPR